MALRKTRTSSHASTPTKVTPIVTYTVTVAHEPGAACDSCALPRPVLIEQEGGAWVCEICSGDMSGGELWRAAMITGIYSGD